MSSCRTRDIPEGDSGLGIGDGGTGCIEGHGGLKSLEGWGGNDFEQVPVGDSGTQI